jgi:hypothetical protein
MLLPAKVDAWMISTSEMIFGWLRMREIGTPAVGIMAGARGVVTASFFGSVVFVVGIWHARKDLLSATRNTVMDEANEDCGSVSLGT